MVIQLPSDSVAFDARFDGYGMGAKFLDTGRNGAYTLHPSRLERCDTDVSSQS
jgi:hypothetical protein